MYVCTYVCMHACMYVCIHACMHTYIHTYTHTYMNTYIRMDMISLDVRNTYAPPKPNQRVQVYNVPVFWLKSHSKDMGFGTRNLTLGTWTLG